MRLYGIITSQILNNPKLKMTPSGGYEVIVDEASYHCALSAREILASRRIKEENV